MSTIKWQDFLNVLTLKGIDTGVLSEVSSNVDNRLIICYNANRSYLEEWLVTKIKQDEKSSSKSVEFRLNGNKVYQKGKDWEALKIYNLSVAQAPYHTNDFSLALSNRSAVLARLGFFSEAIQDIDLALEHGDETIPIQKLLTRKAILLHKLKHYEDSFKLINTLFPHVNEIQTHENKELRNVYADTLHKTSQNQPNKKVEPNKTIPPPKGGENKSFPSASINASLKCSKEKGRYVVAEECFEPADVIFVEKPFALVVLPDQYHKHCHNCCKETVAFVPCSECTRTLFCSDACRTSAWSTYHQWECKGLDVCHSVGIAHLGLRVALLADSSNKYKRVFDLLAHLDKMPAEDLYQYTVTAVFLTLYLKNYTSYFESNLTVTFEQMGNRVLRHITQLVCNGHAITKIDETKLEHGYSKTVGEAQKRIATAIYPSVSMLNHSCDHNISNSFINEYLVVRASRVIKKDEEVFNCYGPHYSRESTQERQKLLQSQYFFKCKCVRCCNPNDRKQEQFSALLCSLCSGPVMQGQGECADCHTPQPLMEMVNLALTAQQLHHLSEKLMKEGSLMKALSVLQECVQISSKCLYKHNSDLRTYKDCLARVYAEMERFGESVSLVEECIVSIEAQFGNSIELTNELLKLISLLESDITKLVESGLQGSPKFSDKLEKLKGVHNQTKKAFQGNVDNAYLNSIASMIKAFEDMEFM